MSVEGEPPDQLATSYIPLEVARRVPRARDAHAAGLLNWLEEEYGPLYFHDVLSCRMPDQRERELLDLQPGTPVLILNGATYDQESRVLQHIVKAIASDRLETAYLFGKVPEAPAD
jgi:DNA-binding GntR family transcriptional regulator